MTNFIIPTKHNNFRAHLLSKPATLIILLLMVIINFLIPVNSTSAQENTQSITVEALLQRHNEMRRELNLSDLKINNVLSFSAQNKANEMLRTDCWSHYCPNGRSPWEFFKDSDYNYVYAGENLAEGFYNIDTLMNAWYNSPTHRENILKNTYQEVGFGFAYGNFQNNSENFIVVAHFGTSKVSTDDNISKIKIVTPSSGVDLEGKNEVNVGIRSNGVNQVNIFLNNNLNKIVSPNEGMYIYKLNNIPEGENTLSVEGTTVNDSKVVDSISLQKQVLGISDTKITPAVSINPDTKNILNLGVVLFLIILFAIDFLLVTRKQFATKLKSFSHYHIGLFGVLFFIILMGGFSAQIGSGINL